MPPLAAVQTPARTDGAPLRCRLCDCKLEARHGDALSKQICRECTTRPEARALPPLQAVASRPRDFTAPDLALIRSVHGYMPAPDLLAVLNQRLVADIGSKAAPYTLDQLQDAIHDIAADATPACNDWASLRKLIGQARRSGLLAQLTMEVVQDFAVVFSLSQAQAVRAKDTVRDAQDGSDAS